MILTIYERFIELYHIIIDYIIRLARACSQCSDIMMTTHKLQTANSIDRVADTAGSACKTSRPGCVRIAPI